MRDASLIIKFNLGDKRAWSEMYKRYHKPLFYFVHKIIDNGAQAEEIVQDCFTKIHQTNKIFDTIKDVEIFLFIIARNAALNFLKKANTERKNYTLYSQLLETSTDIESVTKKEYDNAKLWADIVLEVQKHPRQRREVFVLRYFEGKEAREIAEIKGIHVSRVYNYCDTLIRALRTRFGADVNKFITVILIISNLWYFFA